MQIEHIDILSVPVKNQEEGKRFYRDVLGFRVLSDDPMGENQRWVQLGLPGAQTSITLVNWFDAMPPGCLQGVVLRTADLDSDHTALRERDLEISDIDNAPWGRYATFTDPDGNGWVLQEAPAG